MMNVTKELLPERCTPEVMLPEFDDDIRLRRKKQKSRHKWRIIQKVAPLFRQTNSFHNDGKARLALNLKSNKLTNQPFFYHAVDETTNT